MLRTQISLTEDERLLLDAVSARTGRSIASLIRAAVDMTYGHQLNIEDDLAAMRRGFGSWADRDTDSPQGPDWVDQLRSGRRLREST